MGERTIILDKDVEVIVKSKSGRTYRGWIGPGSPHPYAREVVVARNGRVAWVRHCGNDVLNYVYIVEYVATTPPPPPPLLLFPVVVPSPPPPLSPPQKHWLKSKKFWVGVITGIIVTVVFNSGDNDGGGDDPHPPQPPL